MKRKHDNEKWEGNRTMKKEKETGLYKGEWNRSMKKWEGNSTIKNKKETEQYEAGMGHMTKKHELLSFDEFFFL